MKEILDLFKWYTPEKIMSYTLDGFSFYIRPIAFINKLKALPREEGFYKLLFYFIILISLFFLSISNGNLLRATQISILIALVQIFIDILPLALGLYFTKRIYKIDVTLQEVLGDTVLFLVCCNIFLSPIHLLLMIAFEKTEAYQVLWMANLFAAIYTFFRVVVISKVYFNGARHIIMSVLITALLFNIEIIILGLVSYSIDKRSLIKLNSKMTEAIDAVGYEFFTLEDKIAPINYDSVPIFICYLIKNKQPVYYWFVFPSAKFNYKSITSNIEKNSYLTDSCIVKYSKYSSILSESTDSLKFKRNKEYFKNLNSYYKYVLIFVDSVKDGQHLSDTTRFVYFPANRGEGIYIRYFDMPSKKAVNIMIERNDIYNSSENAAFPMYVAAAYIFPAAYLLEKMAPITAE